MTGFGRTDTHELPNSLTWGPDGWLYGLNGVFNYSDVKYAESNPNYKPDHPGWKFTCALFRVHPRTREFQIFCEGTSNPWGLAINDEGDFFVSACVIDHLWHLVETGYYIRQGGPYPPHTWPIGSIVEHKHQKAAYCGLTWFDSDAYPEEYRKVLYMGNIHGGCINADVLARNGSTYKGAAHPGFPAPKGAFDGPDRETVRKIGEGSDARLADFLTANDAWFMPVVQKTGPDGCLYVLDWYDRYHCYQDANADPDGIERAKGRLYRVRYKNNPHAQPFDLAQKTDDELIELLSDPNVYMRETAQRLLGERANPQTAEELRRIVLSKDTPQQLRLTALWSVAAMGQVDAGFLNDVLQLDSLGPIDDPLTKSWGIRLAGNAGQVPPSLYDLIAEGDSSKSPIVRLQVAIAKCKLSLADGPRESGQLEKRKIESLIRVLDQSKIDDPLLTQVVWANLNPLLAGSSDEFIDLLQQHDLKKSPQLAKLVPRVIQRLLATEGMPLILEAVVDADDATARECIGIVVRAAQNGEFAPERIPAIKEQLAPRLAPVIADSKHPLQLDAALLAIAWNDASAANVARQVLKASTASGGSRVAALQALIAARHRDAFDDAKAILNERGANSVDFRAQILGTLGRLESSEVGEFVLANLNNFEPELQPRALELLTQRPEWTAPLLAAIADKSISKDALNLNQLRRIASFTDPKLKEQFTTIYGAIREGRNPARERMVNNMADFLHGTLGNPHRGVAVFKKVCAQCHKIYGEGAEVGPDITLNGRNNWQQLLSNVFDPSLVIGPGYQARQLLTSDGRVLTGLPVEESDQRVVLKVQGGKLETIAREDIDEYKTSEVSLMPEELEKQLTTQEIADLMSYLALDKPPEDPSARYLPGAPVPK